MPPDSRGLVASVLLMLAPALWPREAQARPANPLAKPVNETQVQAPVDDEACFAPDEPCDIKLVKFVRSAKKSIDVAIFDLNLDQLVHELLLQSRRIPVRFVVDVRQAKASHSLVPMLIRSGARVRIGRQRGIMHNKFLIVDEKRLETGSFNYTNGAAFKNSENQLYLATPAVVSRYRSRFEKLWNEGFSPAAKKFKTPEG